MLEESRAIVEDGHFNQKYSEEYEEALVVSRKWMRMSEEISKVNWFLKVREGIRKQMNIWFYDMPIKIKIVDSHRSYEKSEGI